MITPDISVIIPAYNPTVYLQEAVISILQQTLQPKEILIVDDGSTHSQPTLIDNILKLSKTIHYTQQSHQGAAAARNNGINLSKSKWIAFLDADDIWLPEKIEQQWLFATQQHKDIIFTHIQQFISPELCLTQPSLHNAEIKHKILPGYCATTLFIKKKTFFEVGYFDTSYKLGEFIAWYLIMKKNHLHILLPNVLAKRRIHQQNTSYQHKSERRDYLKILMTEANFTTT